MFYFRLFEKKSLFGDDTPGPDLIFFSELDERNASPRVCISADRKVVGTVFCSLNLLTWAFNTLCNDHHVMKHWLKPAGQ